MEKVPMTLAGYEALQTELKTLKGTERPAIIQAIAEAREHGDLSENAEYHAARERQSFVEGRIAELEDKTSRAEIIDPTKLSGDQIMFGATVIVADCDTDEEKTFQIVGESESDIAAGKLAVTAPMARALIGKSVDDVIEVHTPRGTKDYEIVSVEFK